MTEEQVLNNINGYQLDDKQRKVVTSNDKYLLVSAGAGSGKTLTIIGKIRYLIEIKKLKEDEIICISFTNEATNNLKSKLKENYGYNVPCYTFHKLGLEILKNDNYKITEQDLLKYTINRIKILIEKFINLIKSNDYNETNIISFIKQEQKKQSKALLIVILYIYKTYQQELRSKKEIDFSDMISLATKKVNEKR